MAKEEDSGGFNLTSTRAWKKKKREEPVRNGIKTAMLKGMRNLGLHHHHVALNNLRISLHNNNKRNIMIKYRYSRLREPDTNEIGPTTSSLRE